jgi:hypothetical protein
MSTTHHRQIVALVALSAFATASAQSGAPFWAGHARDRSHLAQAPAITQALDRVLWSRPVDLMPQYVNGDVLLIHYGSPMITQSNVILWPTKTGATDGFRIEAHNALTGGWIYATTTDYSLPAGSSWTPICGPVLNNDGILYFPAAGGTVMKRADPEHSNMPNIRQVFYGGSNFFNNRELYSSGVKINTPLSVDGRNNVWFGFRTFGTTPDRTPIGAPGLLSGIAKLTPSGAGQWKSAVDITGDADAANIAMNCAPAFNADSSTAYFVVRRASGGGYLVGLNTFTLATRYKVRLLDPSNGSDALLSTQSSATPMVGPDGDVYYGVLTNPTSSHNARGYLLHFNSTLSMPKIPGSFGWDLTPTFVPAESVPSYQGTSAYLLVTKYNNYAGIGTGDGANKVALLDPFVSQLDFISGIPVMKEIMTKVGPTPDPRFVGSFPNAAYEWCINTCVYDPLTSSALINSEDGHIYRWDLTNNTLSQSVLLDGPRGQAYTPTVSGPTGIVYAINNAKIFAVGANSP